MGKIEHFKETGGRHVIGWEKTIFHTARFSMLQPDSQLQTRKSGDSWRLHSAAIGPAES